MSVHVKGLSHIIFKLSYFHETTSTNVLTCQRFVDTFEDVLSLFEADRPILRVRLKAAVAFVDFDEEDVGRILGVSVLSSENSGFFEDHLKRKGSVWGGAIM